METQPVATANSGNRSHAQPYGRIGDRHVTQYTLSNSKGMSVKILDYGGTVTHLLVPDRNGVMGDVVLGFDDLQGYLQERNPYFGCLIGRYANRIANAQFALDGEPYRLAVNNNGNSLHGGAKGFDKYVWDAELVGNNAIRLTHTSADGDEGYPGNVRIEVVYTVTEDNELRIDYLATTDRPTPINLTNHCYFNLSAGEEPTILDHLLMLNADAYTPVDPTLIPTGAFADVADTPFDFTEPKPVGKDLPHVEGGFDHNFVLRKKDDRLGFAASLYRPGSGRFMEVFTTQPGVQFYSGNFLDGTLAGKNGAVYRRHAGLCLETQHFPDSPNQPSFPSTILRPGDTYRQTTVYRFSTL